jgi:hypothetical protein
MPDQQFSPFQSVSQKVNLSMATFQALPAELYNKPETRRWQCAKIQLSPKSAPREIDEITALGPFFYFVPADSTELALFLYVFNYTPKRDGPTDVILTSSTPQPLKITFETEPDADSFSWFWTTQEATLLRTVLTLEKKVQIPSSQDLMAGFPGTRSLTAICAWISLPRGEPHFQVQIKKDTSGKPKIDVPLVPSADVPVSTLVSIPQQFKTKSKADVGYYFELKTAGKMTVFLCRDRDSARKWILALSYYALKGRPMPELPSDSDEDEVEAPSPTSIKRTRRCPSQLSQEFQLSPDLMDLDLAEAVDGLRAEIVKRPVKETYRAPVFEVLVRQMGPPIPTLSAEEVQQVCALVEAGDGRSALRSATVSYVFRDKAEIVQATLKELTGDQTIDFESLFSFDSFGHFDRSKFLEPVARPDAFDGEFGTAAQKLADPELQTHPNEVSVKHFVFLIAVIFINGLQESATLEAAFRELGFDRGAAPPDTPLLGQGARIAIALLKDGSLWSAIDKMREREYWVRAFYRKSALIAGEDFLENFSPRLGAILKSCSFARLSLTMEFVSQMSEARIYRFTAAPMWSHLEIDELFDAGAVPETVIAQQFRFWYSPGKSFLAFGKKHPWDFLSQFEKITHPANGIVPSGMMKAPEEKLLGFVTRGIETRLLHSWILFILVHEDIVAQYYSEEAFLRDMVKAKYVIGKIWLYIKSLGPAGE